MFQDLVNSVRSSSSNPFVFKQKLAEFKDSIQTGMEIYKDGSRIKNKVAASIVINKDVYSARLPDIYFQPKQRELNLLLSI